MTERIRPEVAVAVGRRIRALRSEAGLSVAQLGEASDVSRRMLTQIELGQANPSLGTVDRIASALGTTFAALVGLTGDGTAGPVGPVGSPHSPEGSPEGSPDGVLVWSTPAGSWGRLLTAVETDRHAVEMWRWHFVAGDSYRTSPDAGSPDTMVHVLRGRLRVRPVTEGVPVVEVEEPGTTRITDRSAYHLGAASAEADCMFVVMVPRGV